MARMICKCGRELSNSNHPEIEYVVFNDEDWIRLMDSEIKDPIIDIETPKLFYWKCPSCSRLYFFEGLIDNLIATYKLEE